MADHSVLIRALNLLEHEALAMLVEAENVKRRERFCGVLEAQRPVVADDYELGAIDVVRRNILALSKEIATASTAVASTPTPQRIALVVSYTRTLRGNIRRLLPHLQAGPTLE